MTNNATLFEGESNRTWRVADAHAVSPVVSEIINRRHAEWTALQFRFVCDVSCSVWTDTVLRAYTASDGSSWGIVHVSPRGGGGFELISWLSKDSASLLTTLVPVVKDSPRKKRFRTPLPDASPERLWMTHKDRLSVLAQRFGDPISIQSTPVGFAAAYDQALSVELWG